MERGVGTFFEFKRLLGRLGEAILQRPFAVHGVPVTVNLYGIREARVRRAAVVTFQIVIDDIFPVRRGESGKARRQFQIMHVRAGFQHFVLQARQLRFHALCLRVHIDKHKAGILFQANRHQLRLFAIEIRHVFAVAGVGEIAVKLEGPGVIGAGNHVFGFTFTAQQLVAAVRADVIESAQNVVAAADDNDIFANDLPGDVVVRPGDLAAVGDANPAIGEDALFLVFKRLAVGIKTGRNGPGILRIGAKVNRQSKVRAQIAHVRSPCDYCQ